MKRTGADTTRGEKSSPHTAGQPTTGKNITFRLSYDDNLEKIIILELIIQGYRQTQYTPGQCLVNVKYTHTGDRSPIHQRIHSHTWSHLGAIRVSDQANMHMLGLWKEKWIYIHGGETGAKSTANTQNTHARLIINWNINSTIWTHLKHENEALI